MANRGKVYSADLFCGAGGTSTGLALACKDLNRKVELVAINHWKEAIETHTINHPWAKHLCMNVESVDPRTAIPGGHLHALVASPECTFHSRAAGGRPKNDQRRSSAWQILRWLELLKVDSVLIENVPEFRNWGPLNSKGFPIKSRKGEIYQSFIAAIKAFGYNVDAKILNAADYGAPTSRSRIFIQARKGRAPINWPTPTHTQKGVGSHRWRAAKEIIDWQIQGESIFARKRPLSPRTYARIIEGLKRFGGPELKPFIILMEHQGNVKDIEDPLPTITTAKGGSMAVVQPFILSQGSNGAPKGVNDEPVPSIMTGGKHALVEAGFVLSQGSGGAPRSLNDPVPTIPGGGAHALIIPMFGERKGQKLRVKTTEDPLDSVTSHGAGALAEAVIVEYHGGKDEEHWKRVASVNDPLKTIDTANRFGVAMPFVLPVEGYFQEGASHNPPKSIEEPLGTITQRGYGGVVEAFLMQYNGNSAPQDIDDPLPTVSTKDRFGLVQPMINGYVLDIRFRMLQPHELAAAMGFPSTYKWQGTKTETVKMIGNAVSVDIARALCNSLLTKPIGRLSDF
jgi:DNA (cytosine-5)-methyltransferase 1